MQWHTVQLQLSDTAESYSETDTSPNVFLDRRLTCTFIAPSGTRYAVPGFYHGDGQGGDQGRTFACRFSPPETGAWSWSASLCAGSQAAISTASNCPSGSSDVSTRLSPRQGSFTVTASDKASPDFRASLFGWVTNPNPGRHWYEYAGGGGAWVKVGMDVGEGFLGYRGFDNTQTTPNCTPALGATLKSYSAHLVDWTTGDPDWDCADRCSHPKAGANAGTTGREIIGAVNYLATGVNSKYFMLLNKPSGDTCDVSPYLDARPDTSAKRKQFDVSKLDQWEIVFEHMQRKGICMHAFFGEVEINNLLDGGALGVERKLFYREMIARFAHHPCIEWNIGEEQKYDNTAGRLESFGAYLKQIDVYDHPVSGHNQNANGELQQMVDAQINGGFDFDAVQVQRQVESWSGIWNLVSGSGGSDMNGSLRAQSASAGRPWVVAFSEPDGVTVDPSHPTDPLRQLRTLQMWPWLLSGGFGFETYLRDEDFGHSLDVRINDFRDVDAPIRWSRVLVDLFREELDVSHLLPYPPQGAGSIATSSGDASTWALADRGSTYLLYGPRGGSFALDLSDAAGKTFDVTFIDPTDGSRCTAAPVSGGSQARSLGGCTCSSAAACAGPDVAVLVDEQGAEGPSTTTTTTLGSPVTTTTLPACTTNADCNDGDSCTTDRCSSGDCSYADACSPATIQVDAASVKSTCSGRAGNTLRLSSVVVRPLADRMLVVTAAAEEGNRDCDLAHAQASVYYGGRRLQYAASAVSGTVNMRTCAGIFYLLDPPAGTADVTVSFPTTTGNAINNRHATAFVVSNVAKAGPQAVIARGSINAPNPVRTSVNVSSPQSLVVDVVAHDRKGTYAATEAGQQARAVTACYSSSSATSTKHVAATGSTMLGWSHTEPSRYSHVLAVFAPVLVP